MEISRVQHLVSDLEREVSGVFVGAPAAVRFAVLGLAGGLHVLVEDIPGIGKTTLATALARAAGMTFSRIQFTPDLLPADILGSSIWDPTLREFVFREGPVNAGFILADELNRTSPRTQSAFLEAMQDGQITVDGISRSLPLPFFMMGTQNPSTFTGTFPLPEAELDRFGLCFTLGYPDKDDEIEILRRRSLPSRNEALDAVQAVTNPDEIQAAREAIASVHVSDPVREYIVKLVRATRSSESLRLGASPRAAIFLQQAARARAAASGRDYVMPEDADEMAVPVLAHRVQLSSQARLGHADAASTVRAIVHTVPKPAGL